MKPIPFLIVSLIALSMSACQKASAVHPFERSYSDDPAKLGPIELGRVSWERNFEEGMAKAVATDKPVLLLFQEVPG